MSRERFALLTFSFRFAALVNKGNVLFNKGDYEKAREYYREALNNDSSCVEALYNLGIYICISLSEYIYHIYVSSNLIKIPFFAGLSNKKLKRYEDALDSFYKLHAILRNSAQVMYQIADMYPLSVCTIKSYPEKTCGYFPCCHSITPKWNLITKRNF